MPERPQEFDVHILSNHVPYPVQRFRGTISLGYSTVQVFPRYNRKCTVYTS